MKKFTFLTIVLMLLVSCKSDPKEDLQEVPSDNEFIAIHADIAPAVDGDPNDEVWKKAAWYPMNQLWIGSPADAKDFKGKYKLAWTEDYLYVLAEISDDVLMDQRADGLDRYWDDDCLEIFIDENHSKEMHQFNHSAFAYHIALDGSVADFGTDSLPHYYNDHVLSARKQKGKVSIWECAISIYPDTYVDGMASPTVELDLGKEMGFMIAYCDNDTSPERENFYGSVIIPGEDKNRGYLDAGVFGSVSLER